MSGTSNQDTRQYHWFLCRSVLGVWKDNDGMFVPRPLLIAKVGKEIGTAAGDPVALVVRPVFLWSDWGSTAFSPSVQINYRSVTPQVCSMYRRASPKP